MQEILLRGKPIKKVSGVIFDKDGTLVNREEYLIAIARLRVKEAENIFRDSNYHANDISSLRKMLYNSYGLDQNNINPNGLIAIASERDNLISTATIFSIFGETWANSLKMATNVFEKTLEEISKSTIKSKSGSLLPGFKNLIKDSQIKKIKLAIISNDSNEGIREFLKYNQLENQFLFYWSSDNQPAKPDPNAVIELCKSMGLSPSECALISDADTDMRMAHDAGISLAIGYTAGWKEPPLLYEHDQLISHWNELGFH
ncbi:MULTISPECIES: HAD family hydrolase [unclassified Prochlorococcus]|uniref:HAD family hydrolase n=1 Tax=unclassified Prochlorococcus TaxID=2627481 RepID=UPI000533A2BE|nr:MULTISPECIES: HAD-IA family hydrolase [unclassified Prochlorococcus]KGG16608.1 Haloacid dehalogenase/epoxide hydrolase family protein [Prochlorococcus sp. MIT 0602]KGG18420.1 Haloacid dehalogenase/epoxide hydrolase family protein [Prochlorococcus sp. MIT 0603]